MCFDICKNRAPEVNIEDYFVNFVIESEEPLDLSDDEEGDLNELDAFESLAKPDSINEAEADGSDEEMEEEEEEEEDEDGDEEDDDEDDDEDMEQADDDAEMIGEPVTLAMLNEWVVDADSKKSPIAWKKMLMAFRYVVRSDDDGKSDFTYRVDSSKGKREGYYLCIYLLITMV